MGHSGVPETFLTLLHLKPSVYSTDCAAYSAAKLFKRTTIPHRARLKSACLLSLRIDLLNLSLTHNSTIRNSCQLSLFSRRRFLLSRIGNWSCFTLAARFPTQIPAAGSNYSFVGGVYRNGHGTGDNRRVAGNIMFDGFRSGR